MSEFPYFKFACLGGVFLGNSLSIFFILPFIGSLVLDLGVAKNSAGIGFHQGALISAYFLGRYTGSRYWGRRADQYGRKPILYLSLISSAVLVLFFGFSTSFIGFFVTRFLTGLLSGLSAVVKVMSIEMVDDERHSAKAQMVPALTHTTAYILSPAVGGLLAKPYETGLWKLEIFRDFPYALPCLALSLLHFFVLLPCCYCLPETNPAGRDRLRRFLFSSGSEFSEELLAKKSKFQFSTQARLLVFCQCLFISVTTSLNIAINLLLVAPRDVFHGLQYSPRSLGIIFSIVGCVSMCQFLASFRVLEKFDTVVCLSSVSFIKASLILSIPLLSEFFSRQLPDYLEYFSIILCISILQIAEMLIMSCVTILTNQSVAREHRCELQGWMASRQSILQAIIPTTIGAEFVYFLRSFEWNWIVFAQTSLVTLVLSYVVWTKLESKNKSLQLED